MNWDVQTIRKAFPQLQQNMQGCPLVYFDNAATTQKPHAVIQAEMGVYESKNANTHRGVYDLTHKATTAFEEARKTLAQFIGAQHAEECIWVRGATEGINLIANGFRSIVTAQDNIIISHLEHHANLIPWKMLCDQTGCQLKVIPITDQGEVQVDALRALITPQTKLISIGFISNALGTITPIEQVIDIAHQHHIPVLIDGAQAVSHLPVNVTQLDCDFFVFSGHKMYGPTGIGMLYGKKACLDRLAPYQGGGGMITDVSFEAITYNRLPFKFEAGTPAIAQAIGLAAAADYMTQLGFNAVLQQEHHLLQQATEALRTIPKLKLFGDVSEKAAIISFTHADIAATALGEHLGTYGIAIRTGRHCAAPLMQRLGITGTARVSFSFYNTLEEVSFFITCLKEILKKYA